MIFSTKPHGKTFYGFPVSDQTNPSTPFHADPFLCSDGCQNVTIANIIKGSFGHIDFRGKKSSGVMGRFVFLLSQPTSMNLVDFLSSVGIKKWIVVYAMFDLDFSIPRDPITS